MDSEEEELPTMTVALFLAVLHHGLANFAREARPANAQTVMETAVKFDSLITTRKAPVKN
jgi:hypothetical protein